VNCNKSHQLSYYIRLRLAVVGSTDRQREESVTSHAVISAPNVTETITCVLNDNYRISR